MTLAPVVRLHSAGHRAIQAGGAWVVEESSDLRIEVDGGPWILHLDDRPLPWQPEVPGASVRLPFAVGRLTLTVRGADQVHRVHLDVQPAASKLGSGPWEALLADLEAWLPGLTAGIEGPRQGGLALHGLDVPSAIEALLPLLPAFDQAVAQVLAAPKDRTLHRTRERPLHTARAASRETLAWISRHPREAAWLRPDADPELVGPPPLLPLPTPHDTLDHPANRHLVWLLGRVTRRLEQAEVHLARATCSELNDSGAWRHARCASLRQAAQRLRRLHRHGPLRHVPPSPASEAALLVLLDAPPYARAHRLGRRILASGLAAAAPPEVATRPSYHLYELWCLLALHRALVDRLGDAWRWEARGLEALLSLQGSGTGARFVGAGPDGARMVLLFNPVFKSVLRFSDPERPTERHALTRGRRPDLVLTFTQGEQRSWVALDAKYRSGAPALADAFSSAHIYRDALRWPRFGGPPRAAVLLAPRMEGAETWFRPWFLRRHGVGALKLAPGRDPGPALDALLAMLLLPAEVLP